MSSLWMVNKTYSLAYSAWNKIRSLWLPVHLYYGIAKDGGNSLTFSYLGWDSKILNYWLSRIYNQCERVPYNKLIPAWKINKYAKDNPKESDFAIVELTSTLANKNSSNVYGFVMPRWLKMHLDVDFTIPLISAKRNHIQRQIRKHSLEVEKGSTFQDFVFFYEKMYKPFIASRHKESAVIGDYKKMFRGFKKEKSTIYFVTLDGLRIAGLYEQSYDGIPYMHSVGVLDGSVDFLKMGAVGASYYFAISDHKKNNIKQINLGGTSPLLNDGLTKFKTSLGAKVSDFKRQDSLRLKLLPLENSPAAKAFLTSNSFVYFENNSINCAIFKDGISEVSDTEFERVYHQADNMSVMKTNVFEFSPHLTLSNKSIIKASPSIIDRICLHQCPAG